MPGQELESIPWTCGGKGGKLGLQVRPPSAGNILGKELGPKECGSVLGKTPAMGSLGTQTSQNWISQQDRPMPPPPGTSDSEPLELPRAWDGKQGSGIQRKTIVKACSCAAWIFRNQEVRTGRGSPHPTGVLGRWKVRTWSMV